MRGREGGSKSYLNLQDCKNRKPWYSHLFFLKMPFPLGWYQHTTSSPLDSQKKNITTGNPHAPHHLQPEEKLDVSPCTALLTLLPFLTIMCAILDEGQPESPFTLFIKLVLQNSQTWEKQEIKLWELFFVSHPTPMPSLFTPTLLPAKHLLL